MSHALFVSSNGAYLSFTNALLNSIEKRRLNEGAGELVVYLIHYDLNPAYLEAVREFPFEVIPVPLRREETNAPAEWKQSDLCKSGRYHYLRTLGREHSVSCLMDADLFFVSPNSRNLFRLVEGTDLLVGCNERFKWSITHDWTFEDELLFEDETRLHKFHCNTPVLMDVNHWDDVIAYYQKIVYRAITVDTGKVKKVGDIFAWNIAVQKLDRQDRVVLFPMEAMAQVHQAAYRPWTRLENRSGHFTTFAGDEVFSLHGRVGRKGFGKVDPEKVDATPGQIQKVNDLYRREWHDLNFKQRLVITDFAEMEPHWQELF